LILDKGVGFKEFKNASAKNPIDNEEGSEVFKSFD